ncbi:dsRBD fold-containing protein [Streptomyces sp. NPDC057854]|uniref:dsRBD fold-containing protein n=1 Tax=unclassified Streptomyces TaxID=2593676 RepID=UPI0036ACB322
MSEPTGYNQNLRFNLDQTISVNLVADGTTTVAQVVDSEDDTLVLAEGVARRRKGDRRNQDVGDLLALSRLHADISQRFRAEADRLLS